MMRLWKESYSRPAPLGRAAVLSTVLHVAMVAFWVTATLPVAELAADSIANRIFYIPPPDRPAKTFGAIESIHYINVAEGLGFGPGPAIADEARPIGPTEISPNPGALPADTAGQNTPPGNSDNQQDSVFTILEVDSAVMRSASSAAPAYPLDLLKDHIEGTVRVRYIVDTTGFADPSTFEVLSSTHAQFTASVRDVLPYMRFTPAKIGARKVRQVVEQPFTFHIAAPPSAPGSVKPRP